MGSAAISSTHEDGRGRRPRCGSAGDAGAVGMERGSKDRWNASLMPYLAARPDVMGGMRFHLHKETERRMKNRASSASALTAPLFARGT